MDGRDRPVIRGLYLRVPDALCKLADLYQIDRCLPSRNQAIIELLETHPEIAKRLASVYNEGNTIVS